MAEMLPATSRESAPGQAREGARGAQSTMDKTCEPEDKMYACDREPMLNWPRLAAGLVSQMQAFVCAWRALPLPVQRRLQDEKLRLPLDDAVTRLGRSRRSRHSPGGPQTGTDVRRSLAPPRWPPAGAEASDVLRTASISGCAAADTSMLAAGSSGRGMVDGAFSTRRTAPLSDFYRQQLPAGGFWQSVNVTLDRGGVAPRLQAVDAQGHALCLVCLERVRGGPVVQPAQHRRSSAAGATSSTPPQGNADACGPQLDVASCAAGATSSTPPRTRSPPAGAQGSGANTSGPQQSQLTHADLSLMLQPLPAGASVLLVVAVSHMYRMPCTHLYTSTCVPAALTRADAICGADISPKSWTRQRRSTVMRACVASPAPISLMARPRALSPCRRSHVM